MSPGTWSRAEADALAGELFGFTPTTSQHAALAALAEHRDTLAVLPTGSGKSAIYQLGGLLSGGLTVVVSPLIALQRDQLQALERRAHGHARPVRVAALNSSQHVAERSDALGRLGDGRLDFLLLGPEQLANPETHAALVGGSRPATLLAVDEAHLVSEWGHDFRPEYLRLHDTVAALGRPVVLALTATAAPPVQADITRQLAMVRPAVVVADFDRPNIGLAVRRARGDRAEERALVDGAVEAVLRHETPALVYSMSHARCEDIAEQLGQVAVRAAPFHAGMSARRRAEVQDAFFGGTLDVIAATSAFGMGIDKSDVRTVVHAGVPASLDEYYQEIGRAGRDGAAAQAVLVHDPRSLRIPRLFAAQSRIPEATVRAVLTELGAAATPVTPAELARSSGVSRAAAERMVGELVDLGLAGVDGAGLIRAATGWPADAPERVEAAGRRRQAVLASRIDAMRHYAETVHCRRAELLAYFGEAYEPPCGHCDNDAALHPTVPAARLRPGAVGPPIGTAVVHRLWGTGTLLAQDDHELVVAFDSVGYRHLTPAALATGLLTVAGGAALTAAAPGSREHGGRGDIRPTGPAAAGGPEPASQRVDAPPPAASVTISADDAPAACVPALQKGPT